MKGEIPLAIYQKLLEARKRLGKIEPSKMEFGRVKYDYLSEEEITTQVRAIFDDLGILIYPSEVQTSYPKDNLTEVIINYFVVDAEDESSISIEAVGQGMDSSDKGGPKAMTSAYKYAMRQLLMIPSPGSDPDAVSTEEHSKAKTFPTTKPSLPAPPPASTSVSAPTLTASGSPRDIVVPFGKKYKGETLGMIASKDRSYVEWIAGRDGDLQQAAIAVLKEMI